jgi:hypothetical protein
LALSGVTSAWRSAAITHEVSAALGRVEPSSKLPDA